MDIATDEVRRQLRASQSEHVTALRSWREALARTFDRSSRFDTATKHQILGLPDRRSFLRVGGLTVAMSAVVAACGSDDGEIPESGNQPTSTTADTGGSESGANSDEINLSLLRTAQSIEALAVAAYQAAIDSGNVTTAAIVDAAVLFQSQHEDHAGALAAATRDAGGDPYADPNPYLLAQLGGAVAGFETADEATIVQAAADLEDMAAQTYVYAAGVLTTPELRAAIMSIGTTEARHLTVLNSVLDTEPVAFPFMPTRGRVPDDGVIPAEEDPETPTTTVPSSSTTEAEG